jgi:ParB-like nuclease domain
MSTADDVKRVLSSDYPENSLSWVHGKGVTWSGPKEVPLSNINFTNQKSWNAYKEPHRVSKFAARIHKRAKQGRRVKPVILADVPDKNGIMIVDGHHRSLAYKKLGKPVWGYVAKVPSVKGPWQELHAKQRAADTRSTRDDYGAVPANKHSAAVWEAWDHDRQTAESLQNELTLRLTSAVDTKAIAQQWAQIVATHSSLGPGSAESFLMSHADPVRRALEGALAPAWEQGWHLGAGSARRVLDNSRTPPDPSLDYQGEQAALYLAHTPGQTVS